MPTAATKARKPAKAKTPEDDELEGLDAELAALEAATDLDDLEPDDEEAEEEQEPAKKPRRKPAAKKAAAPPEDEEDDEEDDVAEEPDDAEETSDAYDEMDRTALKVYIRDNELDITVKKSMDDDDIRSAIREIETEEPDDTADEEDTEEDDEPDEEPAKKGPGRPRGSGAATRSSKAATSEAILSADDVATIGGVPEHQVRSFARKYPKAFPKASPKAQYRFSPKQAHAILKGLDAVAE